MACAMWMADHLAGQLERCGNFSWEQVAEVDLPCHAAELAVNGEVIMCAGSIHTPQIMQLSGLGPADQLRDMGIEVKADLPGVGQNMIVSTTCLLSHAYCTMKIVFYGAHELGGRPVNNLLAK